MYFDILHVSIVYSPINKDTIHTLMNKTNLGYLHLAGYGVLFAYLAQAFKGPEHPKFQLDKEIVDMFKETQPGIVPEHYYAPKRN